MTLKQYVILMLACAVCCWGAFILVLFLVNPETSNAFGFLLFYLSLFLALSISFALAGYFFRKLSPKAKTDVVFWQIKVSFRQGMFFAIVVCGTLLLLSQSLFSWLNFILLILIMTGLEFFLISKPQVK